MADVAAGAAVSKALVLYHFHDKDSLLLALVEHAGQGLVTREEAALEQGGGAHALDDYWNWLKLELAGGDLRVLLSLAACDSERVRAAARRVSRDRRQVAARHVAHIFVRLELVPRVPVPVLAETMVAFIDGLAAAAALEPERDARRAFDAVWLALLTLTE